jgi:hypothetical protein
MSGVELAGLVLGVLPLLIQGIESYNEGLDPIKSFMRWEKELPHFIRKLRNQHVHYSQTIGILLAPITEEIELAEMMTDPGLSRMWRDQEIAARLRDRLQDSYDAYQSTMLDIERITKKIASKLDLDRADEVCISKSRMWMSFTRLAGLGRSLASCSHSHSSSATILRLC